MSAPGRSPARIPQRLRRAAAGAVLGIGALQAGADVPAAYHPLVVHAQVSRASPGPARHEFDLDPALAQARREQKSLYGYLGASDCPACRRYETFLAEHAAELAPRIARQYLVVDLRSSLQVQAEALFLKAGGRSLPYRQFQTELGDERARLLVYPSVWLLDTQGRPLMQMPAGTGTFQTVAEQIEILDLVQ